MTSEEAKNILTKHKECSYGNCDIWKDCEYCEYHATEEQYEDAVDMAIKVLEPCEDMFKGNDNTRPYYANEWLDEHKENSEHVKIIGIVYEHGCEDWSLFMTDEISNEDQIKISEILSKYDTTGYSVRNVYGEMQEVL